jgi:hypothetical protein
VAGNTLGIKYSDEARANVSASLRGKMKGIPKSADHRCAISKKKNRSGLRGADLCKRTGRWRAHATINGKQVYLGRFDTAEQAHVTVLSAEASNDPEAWLAENIARRSSMPNPRKGKPAGYISPDVRRLTYNRSNVSGYRGVTFNKKSGKWMARAYLNGVRKHLGYFATPEGAAEAIKMAEDALEHQIRMESEHTISRPESMGSSA